MMLHLFFIWSSSKRVNALNVLWAAIRGPTDPCRPQASVGISLSSDPLALSVGQGESGFDVWLFCSAQSGMLQGVVCFQVRCLCMTSLCKSGDVSLCLEGTSGCFSGPGSGLPLQCRIASSLLTRDGHMFQAGDAVRFQPRKTRTRSSLRPAP